MCGDNSWLRPFADALGWTDAFLDRILMTVILVRDEVEHSRFVLDWQQVLSEREAGDGPAAADEVRRGGAGDAWRAGVQGGRGQGGQGGREGRGTGREGAGWEGTEREGIKGGQAWGSGLGLCSCAHTLVHIGCHPCKQ